MKSEVFNQKRMDRCSKIKAAIMENWRRTNSFTYTVRTTCPVEGMTLDALRKQYFVVGVGDDLVEIPFVDMLVVFSMIEQECEALRKMRPPFPKTFRVKYRIDTAFSDERAARLLASIRIESPFDGGKTMRIVADRPPDECSDDDRRTEPS